MSISLAPLLPAATEPPLAIEDIYRLSIEQYHQMIQAGVLMDDDPVELLEGLLVRKMTKKPLHSTALRRLRKALERVTPEGWFVDSQEPLTFDTSEPEPDAAILRGEVENYAEQHPSPQDVALVVEVAESSLSRDRGAKRRIYARTGIAVYWVVNLVDHRIEVYSDPTGPAEHPVYRQQHNYGPTDAVPLVIAGQEVGLIPVQDVLP